MRTSDESSLEVALSVDAVCCDRDIKLLNAEPCPDEFHDGVLVLTSGRWYESG